MIKWRLTLDLFPFITVLCGLPPSPQCRSTLHNKKVRQPFNLAKFSIEGLIFNKVGAEQPVTNSS